MESPRRKRMVFPRLASLFVFGTAVSVALAVASANRPSENVMREAVAQGTSGDTGANRFLLQQPAVPGAVVIPVGARQTTESVTSIALRNLELQKRQAERMDASLADAPLRIISLTPVLRSEADKVEPRLGIVDSENPDAGRLIWIVRAQGAFFGGRVPPGAKPIIGTTGYLVIDDDTGLIVGMGISRG